jgi:hypothetical protein
MLAPVYFVMPRHEFRPMVNFTGNPGNGPSGPIVSSISDDVTTTDAPTCPFVRLREVHRCNVATGFPPYKAYLTRAADL